MTLIQSIHAAISAVCPIDGVSVGRRDDKSTWRVDFQGDATAEQKQAANAVLVAFDASAAVNQESADAQRRITDAMELQSVRSDNAITALLDATPAQRIAWANNNFPTLTNAEKTRIGMIMNMIAVAMRPQVRN